MYGQIKWFEQIKVKLNVHTTTRHVSTSLHDTPNRNKVTIATLLLISDRWMDISDHHYMIAYCTKLLLAKPACRDQYANKGIGDWSLEMLFLFS
jgi:hypothetical protein